MKRLLLLPLIFTLLGASAHAQNTNSQLSPENMFKCSIPVSVDGLINIYQMIGALSLCAGINTDLFAEDNLRTEIIDFGTYTINYATSEGDEQNPSSTPVGLTHASWEQKIKLEQGLVFGLRVLFTGVDDNSLDEFEVHVIRPTGNLEGDPQFSDDVSVKSLNNNQVELVLFQISRPDEMIPGIWTFEIRRKGRIVVIKRFEMVL